MIRDIDQQFEMLQVQIQPGAGGPAVIAVTSACRGDGKSATAYGLARALGTSGHRTVLVDANPHSESEPYSIAGPNDIAELADGSARQYAMRLGLEHVDWISLARESVRSRASRDSVDRAFAALRAMYQVVIIDTAPIVTCSLARLMSGRADSTIVTVREGRALKAADRELVRMIESDGINVQGIVTIGAAAMRATALPQLRAVPAFLTTRASVRDSAALSSGVVG